MGLCRLSAAVSWSVGSVLKPIWWVKKKDEHGKLKNSPNPYPDAGQYVYVPSLRDLAEGVRCQQFD